MSYSPADRDTAAGGSAVADAGPATSEPIQAEPVAAEAGPASRGTPPWFDTLVLLGVGGVLSFGGFGLLLADLGDYSLAPALLLGTVGTVAFLLLGRVRSAERRPARHQPGTTISAPTGSTFPAIGMLLVSAVVAAWNSIHITRHVITERDPGLYVMAGKWISQHGNLIVPGGGPWAAKGGFFDWSSGGMYLQPRGTLQFQFAHLLPALLAEANNIGGERIMFRVPALLGAIAMCVVYVVGCRLIGRPWLVLAAVTGLAVSLPELYVTRDTLSEPATMVLLWGGIWLLLRAYDLRRASLALAAGLALGGTLMTHIDAVVYLLPLPLLAAAGWIRAESEGRLAEFVSLIVAAVAGLIAPALLGTYDVQRRAGGYYAALSGHMHLLYAGLAASVVVGAAWVVGAQIWPATRQRLARIRSGLATVAGWVVAAALVAAWALRPAGPKVSSASPASVPIGLLQKALGLPSQPTRTYAEETMKWFEWYIGPLAVAMAIAGLALLVVWAVRRAPAVPMVVLAMVGAITVLYLWNPNVTPDQPWAMRRFATAALPLFMLAAGLAADQVATYLQAHMAGPAWSRRALLASAAALVLFPLSTSIPVRNFQGDAHYLNLIKQSCHSFGSNSAILFPDREYDSIVLTQSLRTWCGFPVATLTRAVSAQQLAAVSADFRAEGKTLWMVAANPASIVAADPGSNPSLIGSATSPHELQQTLEGPPEHYATTTLSIYAARLP